MAACTDQTNGVGFQKQFPHHLIARRCDSDRFLKYINYSDPHEFASEDPACLSQDNDIVLEIRF
jgi:hypothetical protein